MAIKKIFLLSSIIFSTFCFSEKVMPMKNWDDGIETQYRLTVKQALAARDDTVVSMSGYIFSSLGDEEYWFKDATGGIEVEIEDYLLHGYMLTPDMRVTIVGELDKEWRDISIEVDFIKVH